MSGDAISLLQQLSQNPEMVTQLQSVLSLLSPQQQQQQQQQQLNARAPVTSQRHAKATGNNMTENQSTQSSYLTNSAQSSSLASPAPTLGAQHQQQPSKHNRNNSNSVTSRALAEAQAAEARCQALEKDVARMADRVEQLIAVVQQQKKHMAEAADKHSLEVAELKAAHQAALEEREAAHTETLRQVLRARQLQETAQRFERTAVLRNTPVNTATTGGSATKRQKLETPAVKPEPEADEGLWKERSDMAAMTREVDDVIAGGQARWQQQQQQQQYTYSGKKPSAPRSLQSAATGKSSVLLANSRSAQKRRTPRTPSMTYADRLHSRSPAPPAPAVANTGTHAVSSDKHTGGIAKTLSPASKFVEHYQSGSALRNPAHSHSSGTGSGIPRVARREGPLVSATAASAAAAAAARPVPAVRSGTSSVVTGPTRSPSPTNPKRGAPVPRHFVFTGLPETEVAQLRAAVDDVGDRAATVASEFDEPPPHQTTHIVCRGTPRSVKALCGLVSGKWLVAPEYILNSHEAGFWLDEAEEGGLRIFPPPLRCQRFLLTVPQPGIRDRLADVILYGGGEVVQQQQQQSNGSGVIVISSGDDLLRYATQPADQ